MKASFHSKELVASLAELERLAQKHGGVMRLAAAPSDQLSIDLAAILASEKSRSASQGARVEEPPRLFDSAPQNHRARLLSRWRARAAPVIAIFLSLLVGVAGIDALSRMAFVAPQSPFVLTDPSDTAAAQPKAEKTANSELAAVEPAAVVSPAPATTPTVLEPAVASLEAEKTPATLDRSAPAATPTKPQVRAVEIAKPARKPHKVAAEGSQTRKVATERHARLKPARVAAPHEAAASTIAANNAGAELTVVSDARRVTQTISGVFNGLGGVGR